MFEHRQNKSVYGNGMLALCLAVLAGCGPGDESSDAAAPASATPPAATTTTTPATTVPATPTALAATVSGAQTSLTWAASTGASGYSVKRSATTNGPYTVLATSTTTSYIDTTVSSGATYYYVVAATNSVGSSANSSQATVTLATAAPVVVTPMTPAPTPTITPATTLPAVAALTNVRVAVNGSSATITFDSVDAALDYRVYALPADNTIQVSSDGSVIVPNTVYRCAGTYQTPVLQVEDATAYNSGLTTRVTTNVNGYTRSIAEATLGHVYTTATAASGLTPVYAVGNPDANADGNSFYRYQASRVKKYTTSASEYAQLVASGWRDDGIAFYVPAQASGATKPVLANANLDDPVWGASYYVNQGAELNSRSSSLGFATAFNVLTSPAAGTRPLMRVHYQPSGARPHDELAVGMADFTRVRNQGLRNPAAVLHYSGITAATTLVVEALDKGCPFQGYVASHYTAAETFVNGSYSAAHQPWFSLADLRNSVANGEVFVNGQYDGVVGKPKAIARAYVNVAPQTRATMDWMSTAGTFSEAFTTLPCGAPDGNCFQQFHLQSSTYDVSFFYAETNHWQIGNVLGELLLNYSDWAADTNGKARVSVRNQKANIAANTFVHATMEVNSVGSGRRYPQLILSDQDIPVQYNLINGRSIILQSFGDYPGRIDLEICDHVTWDVNQQCPRFIFRHKFDGSGNIIGLNPTAESDKIMGAVDAPTKFDLYVSNSRAYVFINDKPYGCANLGSKYGVSPLPVAPTGAVTVTFGDVLYHSGADEDFLTKMQNGFVNKHQMYDTSRHFDNLGFSSGVSAPTWSEAAIPCSSKMTTLDYDPYP